MRCSPCIHLPFSTSQAALDATLEVASARYSGGMLYLIYGNTNERYLGEHWAYNTSVVDSLRLRVFENMRANLKLGRRWGIFVAYHAELPHPHGYWFGGTSLVSDRHAFLTPSYMQTYFMSKGGIMII